MDLIMPGFKKHPPSTGKMKGKKIIKIVITNENVKNQMLQKQRFRFVSKGKIYCRFNI